jgi:aryl-phospho-beta-D-glucosidase BglC (GH1 family)
MKSVIKTMERTGVLLEIGKKGIRILFIGVLFISIAAGGLYIFDITEIPDQELQEDVGGIAQANAFEFVKAMGAGWNLGNTLDSIDNRKRGITGSLRDERTAVEFYETYWGNPVTTPEMIASIAEMGFGAVRVPVTYTDHLDENFNIRAEWLERVEQIVNYVLDNDMYCIINLHHDTGQGLWPWLRADPDNINWMERQLAIVWAQIAEHFKGYGDKLLFESFNEILDARSRWSNANKAAYNAVNRLNQVFVNTVRSTGGNNAERYLIVKTYAGGNDADMVESFIIPDDSADSAKSRLIVGVHLYGRAGFVANPDWTEVYLNWDYTRDGHFVEEKIAMIVKHFINKGYPVIIGEYGAINKNNTAERIKYAEHLIKSAKQHSISCFWWDNGGQFKSAESVNNYALFDRFRNEWFFPELAEAIVNAAR